MEEEKPKLYLNMILKWDEPVDMVQRAIDSVKDYVDGIYIAITYTDTPPPNTDPLVKLLEGYSANILYFKWIHNFAAARQFVMDNTPHGKKTFIYWQDADDILEGGEALPSIVETAAELNHAAVFFNYLYMVELDAKGEIHEVLIEHRRERLIRNDGSFKWIGALHETLIEQRVENITKVSREECVVVHLSTPERVDKNLERNIKILENQAAAEHHKDPRTLIYLGKAYFDKARIQKDPAQIKIFFDLSLALLQEYLDGSGKPGEKEYSEGSGWPEERATAWSYISEIAKMNEQYDVAIDSLFNALREAPQFPNYYVDMAMLYSMKKDNAKAKVWLKLATGIEMPKTTLITTPRDLKVRALEVDYNNALADGDLERAIKDSKLLLEIMPGLEALQKRHITVESLFAANKAAQSVVYLGKYLEQIKEKEKITNLLGAIPRDLQIEKFAAEMRNLYQRERKWESNEIAILCGPGFEEWSPKSIQTGLGGSEEAVVYMSQELKKLGWKVTVYANPTKESGDHQGVEYRPYYEFNTKDEFNVLILWRNIGMVDYDLQAKYIFIWLHDIPSNPDFSEVRVNKVDKIAVLSQYHKSLLRMHSSKGEFVDMPPEKVFVTSNGIPPVVLNTKWKPNPTAMIYASSPDRGLIYLLNNWKKIKEAVPTATLDIFYGFAVYDAIHGNNPARMQWKQHVLELCKQDGITFKGRIGHAQLVKEFATHGVWAYPTDFCVTGDTLVDVPRNYLTYPLGIPIKDLIGKTNQLLWTFNETTGEFELKKMLWAKKTRSNIEVIRVNWTDGTSLKCTPDHKILTYDRGWIEAKKLQTNESVVAFKKHMQVQVSIGRGRWPMEHRIIAEQTLGEIPEGYHVDHIDGNPFNNTPENLQYLSPEEHAKKTFAGNKKTSQSLAKQVKSYKKWTKTKEGKLTLSRVGSERGHKFWDNLTMQAKKEFLLRREINRKNKYRTWWDTLPQETKDTWGDEGRRVQWNHKVASIETVGREDVYDMLVEDNHNFIAGGVVIHNCEISCISAMRAQACGAVPVTTNFAALKETVKNGIKVDMDIREKEGQNEYFNQLIKMLKDTKEQEEIRKGMMSWAQDYFQWSHVAKNWSKMFANKVGQPTLER